MATIRVHPIQLKYHVGRDGKQTCKLCGAEERWRSKQRPTVSGDALKRTVHLVHLMKEHISDVQSTFSARERKKEKWIEADQAEE